MEGNGTKAPAGGRADTKGAAKRAAGGKLKGEKHAQAAAGEKLRFGASPLRDGAGARPAEDSGRRTPGGSPVSVLLSDAVHRRIDRDSDGNAGADALNRGTQAAEDGSHVLSRFLQKRQIRRQYAAARAGRSAGTVSGTAAAGGPGKAAEAAGRLRDTISGAFRKHRHGLLSAVCVLLLVLTVTGTAGSCAVMFQGGADAVVGSSYTADDADILGAEADYRAMEYALQARIDDIRNAYPGYDGYDVRQDQIGHNPYELASYLTVLFEDYSRSRVQETLERVFAAQYTLTVTESVEVRYRTETEGQYGDGAEDPGPVPYEHRTLHVTLENSGAAHILLSAGLTDDQMSRYGLLMQTLGNRPDLFGDDPYAVAARDVLRYDVPGEALTDERFRNMITEAEKYIGYPYVWGGSTPATSFDCSGFVCWVVNHCGNGWNVGRITAEGLRQICAPVSPGEARPGDLIFFQGTYDTPGASHVGIYVGDSMMIHAGNPIQYAPTDTPYRQAHFYCFGRLP